MTNLHEYFGRELSSFGWSYEIDFSVRVIRLRHKKTEIELQGTGLELLRAFLLGLEMNVA